MKVYISKYALTEGIVELESDDNRSDEKTVLIPSQGVGYLDTFYHGQGNEWHKTRESAIKKAEEMRDKKIQSLKKQITKLEKMKFN